MIVHMFYYYTCILLLCGMALGVLCVLVSECRQIKRADKHPFYLTYALIACSALAEWLGIWLNGRADLPGWPILAVKCADYILTPLAGGAFVHHMKLKNRWNKALAVILAGNTLFQVVAVFNGWMVTLDAGNHYTHGPLYIVYVTVYLAIIVVIVVQFIIYGRTFEQQNRASLYAIMLLVLAGIALQEMGGEGCRTAYVAMTMGAALLFIHYSAFSQQAMDAHLQIQHAQLATDALTGLLSRRAYTEDLVACEDGDAPQGLAAFAIDINDLKRVNDTMGHLAGDELICGAAKCIEAVFGEAGRCYRTGGDEFVALVDDMDAIRAEVALCRLERQARSWAGKLTKELRLAAGFALAADYPGLSLEKLVSEADLAMYAAKAEYYRQNGRDRRRR